ncbi:MAG: IclR family transcriptional regulator [Sporolactobacillus sp.]|jgi:DNA-binding IclR family transcriptional regulator|nr:IclR family transcriptional regulator [Sporolactobacillus sp.]
MLKTLKTAMMILNQFNEEKSSWTARELAEKLHIPQVNVYRILDSFEEGGYLLKNQLTKQYRLGIQLVQLSKLAMKSLDVVNLMRPLMHQLMVESDEAVYLVGLTGNQGITLDSVTPKNKVGFSIALDGRAPLYAGASYWSILAFMENEVIEKINKGPFDQLLVPASMTSELLTKKIQFVRQHGWVASHEQFTPDIVAVASPLFLNETVIGSITIAKPIYRVKKNDEQLIGHYVKKYAEKMTNILNYYQVNLDYYVYFRDRHTNDNFDAKTTHL